jgi:protein involved in polysaccharide export with SLBB domain
MGVPDQYLLGCPDVVEVKVIGRPDLGGCHTIGADGRIALGPLGRVRVEGLPVAEAAHAIADEANLPPERVRVDMVAYNSQQVYLFGEVAGLQRAVPYEGPETVVDLLQRTGGITPGAAPGEVHVVRTGVAEGKAPRVFHIDLEAIIRKQDQRTNLRLQAFDQIYVGETRKSCFAKFVPPCFRELYDTIFGLSRTDG